MFRMACHGTLVARPKHWRRNCQQLSVWQFSWSWQLDQTNTCGWSQAIDGYHPLVSMSFHHCAIVVSIDSHDEGRLSSWSVSSSSSPPSSSSSSTSWSWSWSSWHHWHPTVVCTCDLPKLHPRLQVKVSSSATFEEDQLSFLQSDQVPKVNPGAEYGTKVGKVCGEAGVVKGFCLQVGCVTMFFFKHHKHL